MPEYERTNPRDWHERAYRALLRLYPARFRLALGDAMVEFFRDRLADMRRSHGALGVVSAWGIAITDVARQAPLARLDDVRRRIALRIAPPPHAALAARRKDWMIHSIMKDLSLALRNVLRNPWHSALVIVTLALGLGANTAIYSVVDHAIVRPLPFHDPNALLQVRMSPPYQAVSEPEFADLRRDAKTLSGVAAFTGETVSLTGEGSEPERAVIARVSDGFFPVFKVPAALGRTFTPDEERAGNPLVAVLSHGTWQRRYGGDPGVIGRTLAMEGVTATIVGVMPPSFAYPPMPGASRDASPALWLPLRLRYDSLWERNNHYMTMVARIAPGSTTDNVKVELAGMATRWNRTFTDIYPADQPITMRVESLQDAILGETRPYLLSLLAAVAFVLLIACVNVANLQLVRAEARRKDVAIRSALGASRVRLARQGITESLLHAVLGGALGLLVASWGVRGLVALAPADLPRMTNVSIDGTVLLFGTAVTLLTGLALGLTPVLTGREKDTSEALKEGGKVSTAAARNAGRARRRLVTAEIALAVVMLSGAALMVRSLMRMQSLDLGFTTNGVATVTVTPPAAPAGTSRDDASARIVAFHQQLLERVRGLPGVTLAAASEGLPMGDGYSAWSILLDGAPPTNTAQAPVATPGMVTPGWFETLGIGLVRGRLFEASDNAGAPYVVIVNETMARRFWPGKDAIGHTVRMLGDGSPWATIVGVLRDVKRGFAEPPPPTMYFPHAQAGKSAYYTPRAMSLVMRTTGDAPPVLQAVRRIVHEMDASAPLSRETTLDRVVAGTVGARRFATMLLVGFAVLALLLAGIGIYGVISTAVAQRSYEIGVRMALGARRADVMAMIMREGLRTAAIGAGIGLAGALSTTSLMRSMIYDVKSWDPLSLGAAVVALLAVVALACSIPAARATAVDPNRALRAE